MEKYTAMISYVIASDNTVLVEKPLLDEVDTWVMHFTRQGMFIYQPGSALPHIKIDFRQQLIVEIKDHG